MMSSMIFCLMESGKSDLEIISVFLQRWMSSVLYECQMAGRNLTHCARDIYLWVCHCWFIVGVCNGYCLLIYKPEVFLTFQLSPRRKLNWNTNVLYFIKGNNSIWNPVCIKHVCKLMKLLYTQWLANINLLATKSSSIKQLEKLHQIPNIFLITHWGRVTHICVSKLTIIGSDNGLSPGQRQAIVWTNAGILLIGPLGTNFSEILIQIDTF